MSRKSPYRNVAWHSASQRWIAKIHVRTLPEEKTIHLGYYKDEEAAARVADVARSVLSKLGLMDGRVDPTPTFDGKPPPSVPFSEILQRMMDQQVISPSDIERIITPQQ